MSVLDELDKILANLLPNGKRRNETERMRISLTDVEKIDIEKLELSSKVTYPSHLNSSLPDTNKIKVLDLNPLKTSTKHLSSDALFSNLLDSLVLSKLIQVPKCPYPSAKLVICDRFSYDMLMKLRRVASLTSATIGAKNFIYKPPYEITAIFLLSDIVDLFEREREPIVVMRRANGKELTSYNYSILRQKFPYLKLSDLILLLQEKGSFELGNFDPKASREHLLLQFFNHFARTTSLIELNPFIKLIGRPHLIYNNVLILQPEVSTVEIGCHSKQAFSKLPLQHVSYMAERLVQVSDKLRIDLKSISYRMGDPFGHTRVFSQLVASNLATKQGSSKQPNDYSSARVLVLDRYFDIQGPLLHSDSYGAFMEQEKQVKMFGERVTKLRMETMDTLDERLQMDKLTDVLGTILKYSLNLKSSAPKGPGRRGVSEWTKTTDDFLSSVMSTSQSIRRHLDLVKIIYKCLNEGYLLVLRLESNIENVGAQLRVLTEPMSATQQLQVAERLQRIVSALKQLIKISGKSIRSLDILRIAATLIDVINMFLFIHNRKDGPSTPASKIVNDIRLSILSDQELKKAQLDSVSSDELESSGDLLSKLEVYDRLSRETCGHRSTLSLEEIVEKFYSQELDSESYCTNNLSNRQDDDKVAILVIIGVVTPNELSRIKALEISLRKKFKIPMNGIYILIHGVSGPDDFLRIS